MGARRFGPDTAGFLQRDEYGSAVKDLGLSMDPLTQNRHALAGGNPISFMETDGHEPISSFQDGTYNACQGPCGGGSRSGTVSRGTEVAQRWTPGATRNQQRSHPKNPPVSDAATSGNRWPSRRAGAITRKLPGTEHDPTTAGGPVPNDKCFGCLQATGGPNEKPDLGEVLSVVFGDSPLEIAANLTPWGRGANLGRKALGGIARAVGGASRAKRAQPAINWAAQERHFLGHSKYTAGRSQLTADPRKLIDEAGSGQPVGSVPRGQPGFRERIDFGGEIGTYVDPVTRAEEPTSRAILHHGQRGIHIVPARPG